MRLIVIPYSDDVVREGVECAFFRALGLSDRVGSILDGREAAFRNSSLGPRSIAVFREIFTRARKFPEEQREKFFGFDHRHTVSAMALPITEEYGWNAEKFWGLDRLMAEAVRTHFRADNDRFAQSVFGQSWNSVFSRETETENCRVANSLEFDDLDTADKERASALIERVFSLDPTNSGNRATAPYQHPVVDKDGRVGWRRLRPSAWLQHSTAKKIRAALRGRR